MLFSFPHCVEEERETQESVSWLHGMELRSSNEILFKENYVKQAFN